MAFWRARVIMDESARRRDRRADGRTTGISSSRHMRISSFVIVIADRSSRLDSAGLADPATRRHLYIVKVTDIETPIADAFSAITTQTPG